jgi:hypothetical protein
MFERKILILFWITMILFAQPAAAMEQGSIHLQGFDPDPRDIPRDPNDPLNPANFPPPTEPVINQLPPTVQNIPQRVQITCRLSQLDNIPGNEEAAKQVQALKDELYVNPHNDSDSEKRSGFLGGDVHAGTPKVPIKDRDTLQNSKILIPTRKNNEAIPTQISDKKFDAEELAFKGHSITGPFSIGPVLEDAVRIGRCLKEGADQATFPCYTRKDTTQSGKSSGRQNHRNEGEGIVENAKLVGNELSDWLFFWEDDAKAAPPYFNEEEVDAIKNQAPLEDRESLETKSLSHDGESIKNVIETENFNASMGSTCNDNDCLISTYSAFDKYFNAWFSAEMVVGNFGPTLFGATKKLFSYTARRGLPFDFSQNKLLQSFRRNFTNSDTFYGKARLKAISERWNEAGLGPIRNKLIENTEWEGGYTLIKSGSFRTWRDELLKKGGILEEITDPAARGAFFKNIRDLRGWALARKAVYDQHETAYQKIAREFGEGSAQEVGARVDFGRSVAKMMNDFDNDVSLDFPEWWMRDETAGIYNKFLYQKGTQKFVNISADSLHTQKVLSDFADNGNWASYATDPVGYSASASGNLHMFQLRDDGRLIDSIAVQDLEKGFARFKDKAVRLDDTGELLLLDEANLPYIKANASGNVKVYEADLDLSKPIEVTPLDWTNKILHIRTKANLISKPVRNMDTIYNDLIGKDVAGLGRRYTSALDKAFAHEENILKSYFSLRGGAKLTAQPYLYWYAKRGFVNQEGVSAFQLPDSWHEIIVDGERPEDLYSNAYIDFFAQGGSDTGDIFVQVLNKLPWKMVLNELAESYGPFESFDEITKADKGLRSKVENIAFLTHSPENCVNCGVTLQNATLQDVQESQGDLRLRFQMNSHELDAYIVEDIQDDLLEIQGQTLIAFTHATDLKGDTEQIKQTNPNDGDRVIDLIAAQRKEKTCEAAVKKWGLGFVGKPSRVGAVLSAVESAGYVFFGWSAIIGTAFQQILIAPDFQDCVDHIEGYYIHFYDPTYNTPKDEAQPQAQARKKITDVIRNFSDQDAKEKVSEQNAIRDKETAEETEIKGLLDQFKDVIKDTTKQLADKNDAKTVLQGIVSMAGDSRGNLEAQKLFFFWFKGEAARIGYDKTGKFVVEDPETGAKITQDNAKGALIVTRPDGSKQVTLQPIDPALQTLPKDQQATPEDHVRLTKTSSKVPGRKVPQRLTGIGLKNTDEIIFSMSSNANMRVENQQILDCIRQGVLSQTCVPLPGNDLVDVFGPTIAIQTSAGKVSPDPARGRIVLDGPQRKVVPNGAQARIRMNASVDIAAAGDRTSAGKLDGINFENGQITYKPETHELLMWLEHNQQAVIPGRFVQGLRAIPNSVTNPETGCEEPAIDLQAIPISNSPKAQNAVDNFNTSVKKQGPFQVLDTDTKQLVFYSEKENGVCVQKVKVVDKETGDVLFDQPLDGDIQQTPDGIKFKTADGVEHTLRFIAENGVPQLSIDGKAPETLRRAQGPNGGFWYDPESGLWYPENSQFIPLLEAFKQNGFRNQVNPDGSVTGRPGGSPLNINIGGGQQTPFNLPSLPENSIVLLLFVLSVIGVIVVFRSRMEQSNPKKSG